MNTRKEWVLENSINYITPNYYTREETILSVQENFNLRRYGSAEGYSVDIDGIEERVLIQFHTNPLNEKKEDKKIHVPMDSVLKRGSCVNWYSEDWFVISKIDIVGDAYKSAQMYRSNSVLKWYNESLVLKQYNCIILDSFTYTNFDFSKTIIVDSGNIVVLVQVKEDTSKIKKNTKFLFGSQAFKLTAINNFTNEGMLTLFFDKVAEGSDDDTENNVADVPDVVTEIDGVKIQPINNGVLENSSKIFNVYKYISGTVQSDTFTFNFSGLDASEYSFTVEDGNNFTITNLGGFNYIPIKVNCVNDITLVDTEMFIKMLGQY